MSSFSWVGMTSKELSAMMNAGGVPTWARSAVKGRIAMLKVREREQAKKVTAAPVTAAPAIDMDAIRGKLKGAEQQYIDAQNANIDAESKKALSSGLSNMISSGLAGTTAVGGMTAGVGEAATRAKSTVAADAANRTEQMVLQYTNLQQAANEAAASRSFQAQQAQLNRNFQQQQSERADFNRMIGGRSSSGPSNASRGLDVFGSPMAGSQQDIANQQAQWDANAKKMAARYPNLGLVGQRPPNLIR